MKMPHLPSLVSQIEAGQRGANRGRSGRRAYFLCRKSESDSGRMPKTEQEDAPPCPCARHLGNFTTFLPAFRAHFSFQRRAGSPLHSARTSEPHDACSQKMRLRRKLENHSWCDKFSNNFGRRRAIFSLIRSARPIGSLISVHARF